MTTLKSKQHELSRVSTAYLDTRCSLDTQDLRRSRVTEKSQEKRSKRKTTKRIVIKIIEELGH